MTVFGDRASKEVVTVKCGDMGRLQANIRGVLLKRGRDTRDGRSEKRQSEDIATRHLIYKPRS